MMMSRINHITLGAHNMDRVDRFYGEVLGVLGFRRWPKPPGNPLAYSTGDMPEVFLNPPKDWRPATRGNGTHVAFPAGARAASTRSTLDWCH